MDFLSFIVRLASFSVCLFADSPRSDTRFFLQETKKQRTTVELFASPDGIVQSGTRPIEEACKIHPSASSSNNNNKNNNNTHKQKRTEPNLPQVLIIDERAVGRGDMSHVCINAAFTRASLRANYLHQDDAASCRIGLVFAACCNGADYGSEQLDFNSGIVNTKWKTIALFNAPYRTC